MDLFDRLSRRPAVVVVMRDGRRVTVPVDDVIPRGLLDTLVAFVLGLIGGSRREPGGTRRPRR
ncbi:MAG: hypothetical protein MUC54_04100 [Chloroflexi bacterium]|nr:hypothetical protein [Chloroflexota bacterium]